MASLENWGGGWVGGFYMYVCVYVHVYNYDCDVSLE